MAKTRKRLEALSEIYQSEVLYLTDLKIWGEEFRRYLFHSETLTIEKKHSLSKSLFINLESIITLHEIILKELKRRNTMFYDQTGMAFRDNDDEVHITEEISEKYKDLEYHSVYYKYLDRFSIYRYYVSRLPTVEYNLDKECSQNINFAKELNMFFQKKNINLGPKHFIYRASQKLARYTILWKALLHYEENIVYKNGIEELMSQLKEITLDVDKTYGNINASYKVYRFSSEMHYSESIKRRIPLNLFQRKREILKEADIIVKDKYIKEAKELRFILLDTVILLCDVVRQGNIEVKYIISDPMPLYRYTITDKNIGFKIENVHLMEMKKLFLIERGGTDIVVLFFRDESTKKLYRDLIENAIKNQRKSLKEELQPRKILENTNLTILCSSTRFFSSKSDNKVLSSSESTEVTDISTNIEDLKFQPEQMSSFQKSVIKIRKKEKTKQSKTNYFSDESTDNSICECEFDLEKHKDLETSEKHKQHIRFHTKVYNDESINKKSSSEDLSTEEQVDERKPTKNLINRLFGERDKKKSRRSFNVGVGDYTSSFQLDEHLLLFGTENGLFIKKGDEFVNIYDFPVQKIIYDVSNKIILFLTQNEIKCASFVPNQTSINTKTIAYNASNFFYGNTANKLIIASLAVSNSSTTTISLFKIVMEDNLFSVVMDRKLFVGCLVFEIAFFETMLVIACKDFEMVDSDTLKTQELVDPLDLCVPFYFRELNNITALCVFTVSSNLFLVCYDTIGFFIDKYGRTVRQDRIFVWFFEPLKFKVHKKYIICLGKSELAIWSLETGEIIFTKIISNLSFVEGSTTSLLLHDAHNMYKIDLE